MSDGGLRQLFQKHIPMFHWQGIETGSTGRGIPDMNYCWNGIEGWVENKLTAGWSVDLRPEQVAWIERRIRSQGRVWIAIRRKHSGGVRKGQAQDQLWLYPGSVVRLVKERGLQYPCNHIYEGGPAKWHWTDVLMTLTES